MFADNLSLKNARGAVGKKMRHEAGGKGQHHPNGLATGVFSLTHFCDSEMAGFLGPCWSKELVELLWRTWVSKCVPWVISKHWSLGLLYWPKSRKWFEFMQEIVCILW